MPLLAPVITTVRPERSGMSAMLKVVMSNNVVAANNDVNGAFRASCEDAARRFLRGSRRGPASAAGAL
jgi:hypothetical protein